MIIDGATDAVTATNRLLLTYPGLHEQLSALKAKDRAGRSVGREGMASLRSAAVKSPLADLDFGICLGFDVPEIGGC